jgi:hypothetical protein
MLLIHAELESCWTVERFSLPTANQGRANTRTIKIYLSVSGGAGAVFRPADWRRFPPAATPPPRLRVSSEKAVEAGSGSSPVFALVCALETVTLIVCDFLSGNRHHSQILSHHGSLPLIIGSNNFRNTPDVSVSLSSQGVSLPDARRSNSWVFYISGEARMRACARNVAAIGCFARRRLNPDRHYALPQFSSFLLKSV